MASVALPSKILPGGIEKPSSESSRKPNWAIVFTLLESRLLNNTSYIRDVIRRSTAIRMRYCTAYFINHYFILEAKHNLNPNNVVLSRGSSIPYYVMRSTLSSAPVCTPHRIQHMSSFTSNRK
jgi:hypothetical protein